MDNPSGDSADAVGFCWVDRDDVYERPEKASAAIGSRLISSGVAQELAEPLAKGLLECRLLSIQRGLEFESRSFFASFGDHLLVRQFWWAIRDDDLRLLARIIREGADFGVGAP